MTDVENSASFKDGKVWEIDIAKSKRQTADENVESTLEELFRQYDDAIDNVELIDDIDTLTFLCFL